MTKSKTKSKRKYGVLAVSKKLNSLKIDLRNPSITLKVLMDQAKDYLMIRTREALKTALQEKKPEINLRLAAKLLQLISTLPTKDRPKRTQKQLSKFIQSCKFDPANSPVTENKVDVSQYYIAMAIERINTPFRAIQYIAHTLHLLED